MPYVHVYFMKYVKLVPNVILYTVYTHVVYLIECFLQLRMLAIRNVSETVATWLAKQNHDLGETFSIHSLTCVPQDLSSTLHFSYLLPLQSCLMDEWKACAYWLIGKPFLFSSFFLHVSPWWLRWLSYLIH